MTFDAKLKSSITNFTNLDIPDYTKDKMNLYCDFVELIALFSNQDGTSQGDIQDHFFGTKDYSSPDQRDRDEIWLSELFLIIEERIDLFKDDYPFSYVNKDILKLQNDLSWKHKMYLGMLISSKLNIFKDFQSELTNEFELISYYVLKNFLPANSIIKAFGKNSEYKGNAITKIRSLGLDLGLKIDEDELEGITERNNQERGLDIIGWVPFGDKCMNQLVYLGQCACGKDTESKFHDTRRFENYFLFYKNRPQHILFIPYSLINPKKNKFYHTDLIEKDFLIFERKRILHSFNQEEKFVNLETHKIVDALIAAETDIV